MLDIDPVKPDAPPLIKNLSASTVEGSTVISSL
jgi:hypothetical protein